MKWSLFILVILFMSCTTSKINEDLSYRVLKKSLKFMNDKINIALYDTLGNVILNVDGSLRTTIGIGMRTYFERRLLTLESQGITCDSALIILRREMLNSDVNYIQPRIKNAFIYEKPNNWYPTTVGRTRTRIVRVSSFATIYNSNTGEYYFSKWKRRN